MALTKTGLAQTETLPDLPLNKYQFIGTHNSYHLAPPAKIRQFIDGFVKGQGEALNYSHRPLREQLEKLNVRQIELDIYGDPEGGLYSNPLSGRLMGKPSEKADPALKTPGFKILHSPDFDVATTVATLRLALRELRVWSEANPRHEPVLVLLELKDETFSAAKPPRFDKAALTALEAEIRDEMPAGQILTPDEVQGNYATLREAVTKRGWPRLSEVRAQFIFALDNEDHVRDDYLNLDGRQDLKGRLCFASLPATHPAAAWMKRNEPLASYEEILSLTRAGFMVRTRADSDLKEVLANDKTRFNAALSSGAQWISTDAPEPDPRSPKYQVAWPDGAALRLNPAP